MIVVPLQVGLPPIAQGDGLSIGLVGLEVLRRRTASTYVETFVGVRTQRRVCQLPSFNAMPADTPACPVGDLNRQVGTPLGFSILTCPPDAAFCPF